MNSKQLDQGLALRSSIMALDRQIEILQTTMTFAPTSILRRLRASQDKDETRYQLVVGLQTTRYDENQRGFLGEKVNIPVQFDMTEADIRVLIALREVQRKALQAELDQL